MKVSTVLVAGTAAAGAVASPRAEAHASRAPTGGSCRGRRRDVVQGDSGSTFDVAAAIGSRAASVTASSRLPAAGSGQPDGGDCAISYRSPCGRPAGAGWPSTAGDRCWFTPSGKRLPGARAGDRQDDGEPAFAPSGSQLAFTAAAGSRRDLTLVATDGAGWRSVVRDGRSPDWSERGLIAFERRRLRLQRQADVASGWTDHTRPRPELVALRPPDRLRAPRRHLRGRGRRQRARRVVRCSGCKAPAFSPDGRRSSTTGTGCVVVRIRDGRRLSTLVEDVRGGFDASEPPGSRARRLGPSGPSSLPAAWWWRSTGPPGRQEHGGARGWRGRSASPTSTRARCTGRWRWPLLERGRRRVRARRELRDRARRAGAGRRPRRDRGHPHARGVRGRLQDRHQREGARGAGREAARAAGAATGWPRAATSARSWRRRRR